MRTPRWLPPLLTVAVLGITACAPEEPEPTPTPVGETGASQPGGFTHDFDPTTVRYSDNLVPSRGVLWGAAAAAFTGLPASVSHRGFEQTSRRTVGIIHRYVRDDEPFPDPDVLRLLRQPGKPRTFFVNWKPDTDLTFAEVAAGEADERIDRAARHLQATLTAPFFLAVEHEPEPRIDQTPGSGMTTADYRAMYRHVVQRLRAQGVDNMIAVFNPMGYAKWVTQPWFEDLYPGDDVVDWIGLDLYVKSDPGERATMEQLLNRTENRVYADGTAYEGAYNHMVRTHPGKPIMLAEWGYQQTQTVPIPGDRAGFFADVANSLHRYPRLKALIYFNDYVGLMPTDVGESADSLAAWQALSADPRLLNPPRQPITPGVAG